ncbi:acyltransferase [Pseudomonas pseudonitroreducens]|uniref:acyltransferase n=1 Tax=Pseudomonas pseudonitroreducens TaxID=2892326 RepID=UPI0023B08F97|nr:acyltransferase [Pseudomonas pseudonitroreducens]
MLISNILSKLRLSFFLIYSKLLYGSQIRIIKGFPRILNKGKIIFGNNFTAGLDFRLETIDRNAIVVFGRNTKINDHCHIGSTKSIYIGANVLIGSRVTIVDHEHGNYSDQKPSLPEPPPDKRTLSGAPIYINDNVWIAEGAIILGGVSIGYGSIVGANAVVTKDIPSRCIAAGVPARVIMEFNKEKNIWEKIL